MLPFHFLAKVRICAIIRKAISFRFDIRCPRYLKSGSPAILPRLMYKTKRFSVIFVLFGPEAFICIHYPALLHFFMTTNKKDFFLSYIQGFWYYALEIQ